MDTNTPESTSHQAHTIDWVCEDSTVGRTKVYSEIKVGRLKARKVGKRTIILDPDYRAWLAALPTTQGAA